MAYYPPASTGGVSDGDKGEVVVSSSGTVWTLDHYLLYQLELLNYS